MSYPANSRPIGLVRSSTFATLVLLLLCSVGSSWAFPDQFELNSFLYNAPPKSFESHFFNPRMKLQSDHDYKYGRAVSDAPAHPSAGGVLVSQNRKFFTKTPEHDQHFQTILRQQEAATIKDPGQAAMVASDQIELRSRGIRNSLQTSDDDVYEVESAPMEMKSGPYRPRGRRYRKQEQVEDSNMELPVSVSFESNIDHSPYEPKQQLKRNHRAYAKLMEDSDPLPPFVKARPESYSRPSYSPSVENNMHFQLGLSNEESAAAAPYQGRPSRGVRKHQVSSAYQASQHHAPYSHIQYTQMPAADNYQPEHKPRYYHQQSDEFRSPNYGPSPALHEQSLQAHEREVFGSPPVPGSKYDTKHHAAPMESQWLDMGAYSSGKGAFGWYSDVPVGGPHGQSHKK